MFAASHREGGEKQRKIEEEDKHKCASHKRAKYIWNEFERDENLTAIRLIVFLFK